MSDTMDKINNINNITDILLVTLSLLQQITGKSKEEVLDAISKEDKRTDELIERLR